MSISKRAGKSINVECPLNKLMMEHIHKFEHPLYNPTGALNLGVAHNDLLTDMVYEKIQSSLNIIPYDVNYGSPHGSRRLRASIAKFFNRYFKPYYPIDDNSIFAQTGAGASVNQLYLSIADAGDYCMIPAPYYGAFDLDVTVNTGVEILRVYPHNPVDLSVDGQELERVYQEAKAEGKRVSSILITNPDNPSGRCYSKKDIETYLTFASNHQMHVVVDEIYALSTFTHILDEKEDPFISVLSIDYKKWIDPALVHVVYGLSKDFSVNGFRVGFIVDQFNADLKVALGRSSVFSYMSTITDRLVCNIFNDEEWVQKYILANKKALAQSYQLTTEFLKEHNIDYVPAHSGPFLMMDLRSHFKKTHNRLLNSREDEEQLWHNMMQHGVYVAPGFVFHTNTPGYFRLTFALPWDVLEKGLKRLVESL